MGSVWWVGGWVQETLAQIHHVFKSYVKERRGSKLNEECLNGDFFVGEQGLKLGLVDKVTGRQV